MKERRQNSANVHWYARLFLFPVVTATRKFMQEVTNILVKEFIFWNLTIPTPSGGQRLSITEFITPDKRQQTRFWIHNPPLSMLRESLTEAQCSSCWNMPFILNAKEFALCSQDTCILLWSHDPSPWTSYALVIFTYKMTIFPISYVYYLESMKEWCILILFLIDVIDSSTLKFKMNPKTGDISPYISLVYGTFLLLCRWLNRSSNI